MGSPKLQDENGQKALDHAEGTLNSKAWIPAGRQGDDIMAGPHHGGDL